MTYVTQKNKEYYSCCKYLVPLCINKMAWIIKRPLPMKTLIYVPDVTIVADANIMWAYKHHAIIIIINNVICVTL